MSSILSYIVERLYIIPGIIVAISVHEFGHAKAAQLCGDRTSEWQGRVSLDPRAHVSVLGILMLLLVGFGWGRPVMIDPRQFKHPRRDQIIVGLAGVFNNLLCALVFSVICGLYMRFVPVSFAVTKIANIIWTILLRTVSINISLMIFNLLPVPPLDGFGVLCGIFNLYNTKFYWYAQRYGMAILLILLYLGATGIVLRPAVSAVMGLFTRLILWIGV